jgi:hypothetical protein
MSDDTLERPAVLDLRPRLLAKKLRDCTHDNVEIDPDDPVLDCAACGATLDPYVYIRKLATAEEAARAERAMQWAQYTEWTNRANGQLARLHREIAELTEKKNRLWNEPINGRPLGSVPRRRRRVEPA